MAFNTPYGSLSNLVRVTFFQDSTYNINIPNHVANGSMHSFSYTRESNSNDIIIVGHIPMHTGQSHRVGEYIQCGSTRKYEMVDHHSSPGQGDHIKPVWSVCARFTSAEMNSGANTISFGWSSGDGSNQKPCQIVNPNGQVNRDRFQTTCLIIYEVNGSSLIT